MRALLVEDSDGDAGLTIEYLAEPPPVVAFSGIVWVTRLHDALAALQVEPFDVVLLDLLLPDANGVEALHAVLAAAPGVPVIVTTGLADADLPQELRAAGAHGCVVKAVDQADALRRTVASAIRDGVRR
ncbi:MAG: response regulator [Gemmatirosa sp.]